MFWLIIVLWIVEEHLIELFSILKDLDFWMIEIIILSIFNSKMFKAKTYLHQKLINYLNLMPIILKAISIVFSFKDKYNTDGDDYEYKYPEEYEGKRLKNLYVCYYYLIFIGIPVYLI